ncbi:hypothetical protein, partial [Nocardioides sp.]|uniref:hypothetical protein n=1 Tax=Nocardioides sp. TaxID=35761 RepID=UPI002BFB71E5
VPTVFASRYAGHCSGNSSTGDRDIRAATIEPHLKQRGQGEPVIDVYLRHWPQYNNLKFEKRLSLSVQDAQDLIVALEFLVETAERV